MISLENCTIEAGKFKLTEVNLQIPSGGYGILIGKTGSGKTTILEALCGLRKVSAGEIRIDGEVVTKKRPAERNVGFLPQDIALFEQMTVYQHLAFAPRIQKWPNVAIEKRVAELAEQLQIVHLLKRKPVGLSGGERQRVALGRALAVRPAVLCLDEPLTTLDDETHKEVSELIKNVVQESRITTLHITHRQSEANFLGQHFFVLEDGVVRMNDAPFTEE